MKKRYLMLIPTLLCLASCGKAKVEKPSSSSTVVESQDKKTNNEKPSATTKPTTKPTTTTQGNTPNPDPEPEDPVYDIYAVDAYKNITIASPNYQKTTATALDALTYEDLFNLNNKIDIAIEMEDSELEKLQADYETKLKCEIYRHCKHVTITMTTSTNTFSWEFDDVGIRQKGNTSRTDVFSEGQIANLNHFKLSFDETFDDPKMYGLDAYDWTGKEAEKEERENRNILGLSGLDMKWNKNYDATHIKEIYASKLYKACGLLSQDIGLTNFSIKQSSTNKEYTMGLYTLYEPASKSMIKRHLKDEKIKNFGTWKEEKKGSYGIADASYGDLYKASYGCGDGGTDGAKLTQSSMKGKRIGIGDITGAYIPAYERKTNTDVDYNDAPLRAIGSACSNGSYATIDGVMDLEYFAITEACNFFIGNPDDFRNNNNNYMVYIRRTDGKAVIIPIDNDRCFGITKDWNPDNEGCMNRGLFDMNKPNGGESTDIFAKTICASTSNDAKAHYLNYVKAISVSDWVKNETFEAFYAIAKETYGEVQSSSFTAINFNLNDENNIPFSTYISAKLKKVDLNYSLTGTPVGPGVDDVDTGYYGEVGVAGSFNGWDSTNHMMTYNGNGEYTITFSPNVDGEIQFKFNRGTKWDEINWTIKSDNTLSLDSGDNYKIKNLTKSSVVTITINTITLETSVEVK